MLDALLGGRALAAGELARVAGVSAATASEHLGRLRRGGLVVVVSQGRHRYYRLTGPEVATALESLALIAPASEVRSLRQAGHARSLEFARTCYDHLAGRVGVAVHDGLFRRSILAGVPGGYEVTAPGAPWFAELGVDVAEVRASRRSFAIPCLDRTERRPHLAGALGAALTTALLNEGWLVRRTSGSRSLRLVGGGGERLRTLFGWTAPRIET